MAIRQEELRDQVLRLINPDDPLFPGLPETIEEAALNWSGALSAYLSELTIPPTDAVEEGLINGRESFQVAFIAGGTPGITPIDAGLIEMVEDIRVASRPQGVSTAPTAPPPFQSVFDQYGPSDDLQAIAERIADRVDRWVRTATFGVGLEPWQ